MNLQINGVTDEKFTFDDLMTLIRLTSMRLRHLGVKKGDIVTMFCPNCPEWVIMFFASIMSGATVTMINPFYTVCKDLI